MTAMRAIHRIRMVLIMSLFLLCIVMSVNGFAASGDITTVAGGENSGQALQTSLAHPRAIHVTPAGVVYIADTANHRIRKINSNGVVTTVAGNGRPGFAGDGGAATVASLNYPKGVAVDGLGNIYIADTDNHRIRKVDTSGTITTVAGNGTPGPVYCGEYCPLDGTSVSIPYPETVSIDGSGNIRIVDYAHIWSLSPTGTMLNVIVASGSCGSATCGGNPVPVVWFPTDFLDAYIDNAGTVFVVRTISDYATELTKYNAATGQLVPVKQMKGLAHINGDAPGNLYLADAESHQVFKIDPSGNVTVFAGTGEGGMDGDGGPAVAAKLDRPANVFADAYGYVYIADARNNRIRRVDPNGDIWTFAGNVDPVFAGDGAQAAQARLNNPRGIFVDASGNVLIADAANHRVRKMDVQGVITTVAGNGIPGFSGDNGPATQAGLYYPVGVIADSFGNLYIADAFNDRIRKVDTAGIITTIAGSDENGYLGDGGPATLAALNFPSGLIMDSAGNIFIADTFNNVIRKIDTGGIISTYASVMQPRSIAMDPAGNLYTATGINGIQKIDPTGMVTALPSCSDATGVSLDSAGTIIYMACRSGHTVKMAAPGMEPQLLAGTGFEGFSGDGGPASAAMLASPSSVFVDAFGVIYIADSGNNRVRRLSGGLEPSVTIQSPATGFTNNNVPLLSYTASSGTVVVRVDGTVVNKVSGNNLDLLADGVHTVRVEVTNTYGMGFAERTFTVDTLAPTVTIFSPTAGTTNDTQPLLTYSASEGAVTVKVDGVIVNKVSGSRLDTLFNGPHTVRVESKDVAGYVGFAEVTFTIAAPPMVTISSPATGSTNNNTPLLSCTASSGTVVVTVDGIVVNKVSGDNLDPLADGQHTVRVEATDAYGTGFAERTFTVDATAPTVTITSPAVGTTADNQPILTYTVSDGTVTVKVDGVIANKVSGSRLYVLSNGPHTVRVESGDAAGNIGFGEVSFSVNAPIVRITEDFEAGDLGKLQWITSGNGSWTVKSTVKHGGLYAAEAPQSIGDGQSASFEVSRTTASDTISFWYSVSSEANYDFLKFYVDGVQKGQWSGTMPWTQASYTVSAGAHTFKWVYSKDISLSTGSDTAWIDDIVFPLPPPAPSVTIASPAAGFTNSNSPVLNYTVSGGTVIVKVDGLVVNKVSGNMLDLLVDGTHVVRVEATDANGTGFTEVSFTVDTTAPTVAIASPVVGSTNNNKPLLTYTASDGVVVVKVDGVIVSKTSGNTLDTLPDGQHTVRVEAVDAAGNTGFVEVTFVVDTILPIVSITSPAPGLTLNNRPPLTYTVSDGTVVVKVDGIVVSKVSGNTLDPLSDGPHAVRVESTDSAGNTGFANVIFTVDTVPPTISINSVVSPTKNTTQTVTGTRESAAAVTVQVNTAATVGSVSYPTATTWSCAISNMDRGVHAITAIAKDAAGNTANATRSITVK